MENLHFHTTYAQDSSSTWSPSEAWTRTDTTESEGQTHVSCETLPRRNRRIVRRPAPLPAQEPTLTQLPARESWQRFCRNAVFRGELRLEVSGSMHGSIFTNRIKRRTTACAVAAFFFYKKLMSPRIRDREFRRNHSYSQPTCA